MARDPRFCGFQMPSGIGSEDFRNACIVSTRDKAIEAIGDASDEKIFSYLAIIGIIQSHLVPISRHSSTTACGRTQKLLNVCFSPENLARANPFDNQALFLRLAEHVDRHAKVAHAIRFGRRQSASTNVHLHRRDDQVGHVERGVAVGPHPHERRFVDSVADVRIGATLLIDRRFAHGGTPTG